ncbi:MAG: DUF5615 family PIN-like protein [Caldilineaceae bacterium]
MAERIKLYLDEDSQRNGLVRALRARGIDVTTAMDADLLGRLDEENLDFATAQGRVLFSFNRGDFDNLHRAYLYRTASLWHRRIRPIRNGRNIAPPS